MFWRKKKEIESALMSNHAIDIFPRNNSYKITSWGAGNEIYSMELKIQLTPHDWNKLASQEVYLELIKYLNNEGIQERGYAPPML